MKKKKKKTILTNKNSNDGFQAILGLFDNFNGIFFFNVNATSGKRRTQKYGVQNTIATLKHGP